MIVERVFDDKFAEIWLICNQLAKRMAYPSFFCCGDWLKVAAASLKGSETLVLLQVTSSRGVLAVLPLVCMTNQLGGKDFGFLGREYFPDPLGLICAKEDRAVSVLAIKEYLLNTSGWDRFFLDWVLEDELAHWGLPGTQVSVEPFKVLPASFDTVLAGFSKKKRYNLRAGARKFQEAGGQFVGPATTHTERLKLLEMLFSLHHKRATEKKLKSSFVGERVRDFHFKLVAESDYVRIFGLKLKGVVVAVLYGFELEGKFFYYQIAHDPDFSEYSPGAVLLFMVLEDSCGRGIGEFNFLQGDESYKGVWTQDSRPLFRVVFSRGTLRAKVLGGLDRLRSFPKKFTKGLSREL